MKNAQLIPYTLPSIAIVAGASSQIPLKDLPKKIGNRIAHLVKIVIAANFTPTFTTAPTTVGNNNIFTRFELWDGTISRFIGGFNHMRAKERLHSGRVRNPDPDTDTASGTQRSLTRVLHLGPPQMAGAPTDFAMPCAALVDADIKYTVGALTDLSADTTALTGTARVVAWLVLLDEVRIPPAYQFQQVTAAAADVPLPGEALYESMALLNSASFDAISAGDFANIRLDLGSGDLIQSVAAEDLQSGFVDDFNVGEVGGFRGEPEAASDDNHKIVNRATPTALVGGPNDLQVVLHAPPDCRISKLHRSASSSRLQWTGAQGTAIVLVGRILAQPKTARAALAAKAVDVLGLDAKDMYPKTLSKKPYEGLFRDFMPHTVKV